MRQPPPPLDGLGMSDAEIELVIKAAKAVGMTPAKFIRLASIEKADRVASMPPRMFPGVGNPNGGAHPADYTKPSESWDVRRMKARITPIKKRPHLRVIDGEKK